jgi:hypothetical protein
MLAHKLRIHFSPQTTVHHVTVLNSSVVKPHSDTALSPAEHLLKLLLQSLFEYMKTAQLRR